MQLYNYRAVALDGQVYHDSLVAVSKREAYQRLKLKGLRVFHCRIARSYRYQRQASNRDLRDFCLHFAQLDRAGLPLYDCLQDVIQVTRNIRLKAVLHQVLYALEQGSLFSEALAKHPKVFNPLFVQLMGVAEKTGRFYPLLEQMEEYLRWQEDIHRKIHHSLRQPQLLFILLIMLVGLMGHFVIPNVQGYLQAIEVNELPFSTRIMMGIVCFFKDHHGIILGGSVLWLIASAFVWRTLPKVREFLSYLLLKIPWIGNILCQLQLGQFLKAWAMMLIGGVELRLALYHSIHVVMNPWLKQQLALIGESLLEGEKLSQALAHLQQFPPFILRLTALGESTGNLKALLSQGAEDLLRKSLQQLEKRAATLQPILILIMGSILLWVVMAVMLPLYETLPMLGL